MRRLALAGLGAVAIAAAPLQADAAALYFAVQTGMSGGQSSINVDQSSNWTFSTGTGGWFFAGGTFTMKEGSQTTANITLSIYQGTSAAGTLVAAKTLTNTEFCAAGTVSNCQSFDEIPFLFASPITMLANSSYYVHLTSPASTQGSQQYFIKGATSTLTFRDQNGNAAPTDFVTSINNVPTSEPPPPPPPTTPTLENAVPEPRSLVLLLAGLLGLAMVGRRRLGQAIATR